jgi:hypothetical protein
LVSAAAAAPIRNSTSPILNRMIQFNRACYGVEAGEIRNCANFPSGVT